MRDIIGKVQVALLEEDSVMRTHVKEGPMGGVTAIHTGVRLSGDAPFASRALARAGEMISQACSESDIIFPIGPNNLLDDGVDVRLTASLGFLPRDQHCTACWKTYQDGYCPRPLSCRKRHPTRAVIMEL